MSPLLNETDIQYVILVPAMWAAEAKHLMREAVVKAGSNGERLQLVPETVAAANWCTRSKDTLATDIITTGSKCVVIDLGVETCIARCYGVRKKEGCSVKYL
ncbi:hypothetical protein DPMN_118760 [Dreissena polymorpha]|uniref:Uncharacterized protein n=1 Tax=Dreissena polymorpha TaxID=45954 RepID=A0A9D4GKP5_DREPO|nr:hypothetical protein DPMN_118760 [Dreissena polymorpha]